MKNIIFSYLFFIILCILMVTINISDASNTYQTSNLIITNKNLVFCPITYKKIEGSSLLSQKKKLHDEVINIISSYHSPLIHGIPLSKLSQSTYFSDTSDFLKNIPGISSVRNGGTNNDIVFRGMSGSRIRMLSDCGEVLGVCCSRMDPAIAYISSDTFDIINIIKGPQTVLWGPVTSGGIVQFQRYHPCFDRSKIQLHSNYMIGSHNRIIRNVNNIIGNKNGYFRLISNISSSDDYKDGDGYKVYSAWNKWNIDTVFFLRPILNTCIEINLGQGNGRANYPTRSMDGIRFARKSCALKIETVDINRILDKIELQIWLNYIHHIMADTICNNDKLISISENTCCLDNNLNNSFDRFVWGIRGISTSQWENVKFRNGIDLQINQHRKQIGHFFKDNWIADILYRDFGIFSEITVNLPERKKITGGARLHYTVTDCEECIRRQYDVIYPAGFIRYEHNICESLFYYIGMGTSRRFPDYWELNCFNRQQKKCKTDNFSQLKSEKTIQIDVGAYFKMKQMYGGVSSYIGYVGDFISCDYNYINIKKDNDINNIHNIPVKIFGAEMELNYKFNNYWSFSSSIAESSVINIQDRSYLSNISPLVSKISCQWKNKNIGIIALWQLTIPSLYFSKMNINNELYDSVSLTHTKKYTPLIMNNCSNNITSNVGVFSICLTWFGTQHHRFSIGINNLFNSTYQEYPRMYLHSRFGYSENKPIYEPGRIYWMKVNFSL